jgi:hypothetical protein
MLRVRTKSGASYSRFLASGESAPPASPLDAATLADFGYAYVASSTTAEERAAHDASAGYPRFDTATRLMTRPTNTERFAFRGEAHYTKLKALVRGEVRARLAAELGLVELDAARAATLCPARLRERAAVKVFHSAEAFTSTAPLLVLVHGSGDVRAGLWALRLATSESLEQGCCFGYIERAVARGWNVLLLDSNLANFVPKEQRDGLGRAAESEHVVLAWDALIAPAAARAVAFVAHSAGGRGVLDLVGARRRDIVLTPRVAAIALTDAVHPAATRAPFLTTQSDPELHAFLATRSCDWVQVAEPAARGSRVGAPVPYASHTRGAGFRAASGWLGAAHVDGDPIPLRSAGTDAHVWTSWCAMEDVFRFLDAKLAAAV